MKRLTFIFLILLLSGCTNGLTDEAAQPTPTEIMNDRNEPIEAPLLEEVPTLTWQFETVDLDETTLEYATLLPPEFDPEKIYPLLLALPPGGQDKNMVNAGLETFWQRGALYNFVIVSPVKPEGSNFMGDGSLLLPAFVAFLQSEYNIEGGKPHLGGISNGGISTFKAGLERPDLYQSLTVAPGYAAPGADVSALVDHKIMLYVGENDGGWVTRSQDTYDRLLAAGHPDPFLDIVEGEGHIITPITGNGMGQIFEALLKN